jgi:hypothetical protein
MYEVRKSPGGSWMTTKAIIEIIMSVGIAHRMRRMIYSSIDASLEKNVKRGA